MDTRPADAPDGGFTLPASRRPWLRYMVAALFGAMVVATGALAWPLLDVQFPSAAEITSRRAIELKSADGRDLFQRGHLRLAPVQAKDMPAVVVDAVLSIEDRRFYQHGGVDLRSELRAFRQNINAGKIVAGGSTITQQLVKTLFLGPERTYKRKIQEAAISMWIEHQLTKNEILTAYLNDVYLGSGATGLPAAAKLYFDKNVHDLNLPEAAMLAGMINAPGQDDPFNDLGAARKRAAAVLDAMVANGKLTEEAALVAKLHPATPSPAEISPPSAGWFVDWVYSKAAAVTPALGGAVRIRTTLDLRLQKLAADIVKSTLAKYGNEKHASQAALVAMRPDGEVVAMVGGRSYDQSQYNRAVQAERQPGSAFKLFDYYAALRQGYTPNDEIQDAPIEVGNWQPENYGRHNHGEVTLADAFADSLNDAAVRLSQQVGIGQVIAAARDLGLRGRLKNNPSLALGTSEVSLLDLTSAYAAVRAGKAPVNAQGIAGIEMGNDQHYVPVDGAGEPQHSLGPYQAELIDLLRGVVEHGTGRAAALAGFAAGKTGTSQDYRDAWFVGFNDQLVVGVWVGNDDHSPMKGVVGGSLPAKIWKEFMEQANTPATSAQQANTPPVTTAQQTEPEAQQSRQEAQRSQPEAEQIEPEPGAGDDQSASRPAAETQIAQCHVPVCEQYYRSFRLSDCTYQPYSGGPRQYCAR